MPGLFFFREGGLVNPSLVTPGPVFCHEGGLINPSGHAGTWLLFPWVGVIMGRLINLRAD